MNRIVKVIYQCGYELEPENILPLEISEDKVQQRRNVAKYNRQFKEFEEKILSDLDEDIVEDYAMYHLDLIKQSDIEEKELDDFPDFEILEEAQRRRLVAGSDSIISEQFMFRSSEIVQKGNHVLLDGLLSDLENKLKI